MSRAAHRCIYFALLLVVIAIAVPGALAQQFVDQTASRFPSPDPEEYSNQLTIGDLDNDGDLDLIFANGGDFGTQTAPEKARVYINDGTGDFTDETDARTGGLTGSHRGVELGDCDNDGDLDVILAQDFNKKPNLLINDGTGNFTSEGATRLPSLTLSSSRAQFGDVDNDGDLDIFITNGGTGNRFGCGQYRLYENDGTCNYTDITSTNFPLGNVCSNMDCIFGDIDGDFDIDIRTASTGNANSRLYKNDGTGVFTLAPIPTDGTCYSYDFGDIDGDGDLDLLGVNGFPGSSAEFLLENDGTGTYTNISGQISPNPSQDDNDSKFLDYDNDGDLDLLIGRLGGSGEKLYNNDGLGNFTQTAGVVQGIPDSTLDVAVGDLTGNGAYDFVTAQGESGSYINRIYINNGPADTMPPTVVDVEAAPTGGGPWVIRAAILDNMTSDRNFFADSITLNFSVDGGANQSVPMMHSGGQIYRGIIPVQTGGASIEYFVRATDHNGNTGSSGTQQFEAPDCTSLDDCNGNGTCTGLDTCVCDDGWGGSDCGTFQPANGGQVPDGSQGDSPLQIRVLTNGSFRLTWDDSCGSQDEDYAVYRGTMGDYTTHEPLACSTNSTKTLVFVPEPLGSHYYLVVPTTFNAEGSYGLDSDSAERPSSLSSCAPQAIEVCQ